MSEDQSRLTPLARPAIASCTAGAADIFDHHLLAQHLGQASAAVRARAAIAICGQRDQNFITSTFSCATLKIVPSAANNVPSH
jgi:hypothetical protein